MKKKPIKTGLRKIYKNHGAITFLLAFYPLIPSVVERHTKSYLAITQAFTGIISDVEDVIKVLFGERGIKAYKEYVRNHPNQILSSEIFESLYDKNDTDLFLKLMQTMFFDKVQRNFQNSDKMRAAVIQAAPEIFRQFSQDKHRNFRSKTIRLLANHAVIDQSLLSQLSFIEVSLRLLTQIERHKKQTEKEKLHAIFASIEAKIKSELAGNSSAFTAPLRPFRDKAKDPIILSDENAHNLHEVLLLLAVSPALEVREEAKIAILELNRIKAIKI